jgi:hypothetical protein
MKTVQRLTVADFARLFQVQPAEMPMECCQLINTLDFTYTVLDADDREGIFLQVVKTLDEPLEMSGSHRQERWEEGWTENLNEFIIANYDLNVLIPKYVKKGRVIHTEGRFIQPFNPDFEVAFVTVLRIWMVKRYFSQIMHVYEFGCGTGHNLAAMALNFPEKYFYGTDWARASQKILKGIAEHHHLNVSGQWMDLFNPDPAYTLEENSGIYTIGAMEQLGENFENFLQFLLNKRPKICVNVEITYELYESDNLYDYLAIRYLQKRKYLKGFLARLRELEREGKVEIIQTRRLFGPIFHEGYTILAWRIL